MHMHISYKPEVQACDDFKTLMYTSKGEQINFRAKVFTFYIHFWYCFFPLSVSYRSSNNFLVLFLCKYFRALVSISLAFLQLIKEAHDKNLILQLENDRCAIETSLLINVYFFLIKLSTNVVFSFLRCKMIWKQITTIKQLL